MEEDKNLLLIVITSIFALAATLWVFYVIIKSASRGEKIYQEAEKQTLLLTEIARKNKVEEKVIEEILYGVEEN